MKYLDTMKYLYKQQSHHRYIENTITDMEFLELIPHFYKDKSFVIIDIFTSIIKARRMATLRMYFIEMLLYYEECTEWYSLLYFPLYSV